MDLESTRIDGFPVEPPLFAYPTDKEEPRCIVGKAQAFMLKVSSIFGIAPLRFESQGEGFKVSLSKSMCVYSYILVTSLATCAVLGVAAEIVAGVEKSVHMHSRITQVICACDVLSVVVTTGVGVYGAPGRMRTMLKHMNSITVFDYQLGQYYFKMERNLCVMMIFILLSFSALLFDDYVYFAIQGGKTGRQWDMLMNYAGFYLLWLINVVLELQFGFIALCLRSRFRTFNEALHVTASQICEPAETCQNFDSMTNCVILDRLICHGALLARTANGPRLIVSSCEAIDRLAKLRCILSDVVRHINDGYGLTLLITLISTLLYFVITPYFIIMELFVFRNRPHYLLIQIVWCIAHIIRLLILVEPSHHTLAEILADRADVVLLKPRYRLQHHLTCPICKNTEDIVSRLIAAVPLGGKIAAKLEMFSRQLMLQNISYSPLDMCTLDRTLIVSILGAVTTYLVILIQFQINS